MFDKDLLLLLCSVRLSMICIHEVELLVGNTGIEV